MTAAPPNGTLAAWDAQTRRTITFTDYVRDGETVAVYRTMEAAEEERGGYRMMRVVWDGDDPVADADEWVLEPVAAGDGQP